MAPPAPPARKTTPAWNGGYRQNKVKAIAPPAHGKPKGKKGRSSKKNQN